MSHVSRRRFLQAASTAGVVCGANLALGPRLLSQALPASSRTSVRILADTRRTLAPIERDLFGSFLEHLGRAIYEGIYDPNSKLSDSNGFRKDVLEEIRKLSVPIIRYPGGNFVSGYNWPDGIGPKEKRPAVLDKAWNSMNSNAFGTDEFLTWCHAAGTEPLLGLNLGTGTPEQAAAERDGIRFESRRRGAADALRGSIAEASGLRVERAGHADVSGMGPASFGRMLRVCGRDFAASLL